MDTIKPAESLFESSPIFQPIASISSGTVDLLSSSEFSYLFKTFFAG